MEENKVSCKSTSINIANRIQEIKNKLKISHKTLTEYLGISEAELASIEEVKQKISSDMLESLATLCLCDTKQFLSNMDKPCQTIIGVDSLGLEELKGLAAINRIALNQKQMGELM